MSKIPYRQNIDDCFAEKIGGVGIIQADYNAAISLALKMRNEIDTYQNGVCNLLFEVVNKQDDITKLQEIAALIRQNFDNLIILGTGGSTLNPQSIIALKQQFESDFKIYFADNLDPIFQEELFAAIDIKRSCFLVISKSGGTLEVLAHFLLAIGKLEDAGVKNLGQHFYIINDPINNILREIGQEIGAVILDHEAGIGGRFASFTNVALLPALVAGFDVIKFRHGAKIVVDDFLKNAASYPLQGAAIAISAMQANLSINVFMPYIEALKPFTSWVCQIWAESLGKEGKGSTPIRAAGTLDQHSQLQLYLDGPADKLFNIIGMENVQIGAVINSRFANDSVVNYLQNKSLGEINMAACQATSANIAGNGRPVRVISLAKLDEETLGALMMHFTIETILVAQMLGINAFDQPAVEDGKRLAREILGVGK